MKKHLLFLLLLVGTPIAVLAQSASYVLEHGIRIKSNERIFLKLEDSVLKYNVSKMLEVPYKFMTLKDSCVFLSDDDEFNVFLLPLNPLKFNFKQDVASITDPIDSSAAASLGAIIDGLNGMQAIAPDNTQDTTSNKNDKSSFAFDENQMESYLTYAFNDSIVACFNALKALGFEEQEPTLRSLGAIDKRIKDLDSFLKKWNTTYEEYKTASKEACGKKELGWQDCYFVSAILKDFNTVYLGHLKSLNKLNEAYQQCNDVAQRAKKGGDGLSWMVKLQPFEWSIGKIALHTVSISDYTRNLNQDNLIVDRTPKLVTKKTYMVRKHNYFIPEVTTGILYSGFTYNTYGTTTDSAGQQFIASPDVNSLSNVNINEFINFNLYRDNSYLHPFYQLGMGLNTSFLTLATGVGIRSNINGVRRLAISGGMTVTWLKELDELKVGDKVSGTDDINKDLKYQFTWPPKGYIAIQYSF